jgi:uncharacterized phosphosugar-binding protein
MYEILPFIYIFIGSSTFLMPDALARSSGLLLIITAVFIIHLRLSHRRQRAESAEQILAYEIKKRKQIRKTDIVSCLEARVTT